MKPHVLITAGPTREYIDPVRYLSNDSSGKMGFALAAAAQKRGALVTLIAGPVQLASPPKVRRIDVISAEEMRAQTLQIAPEADFIIMAAAVADFSPQKISANKIKRAKTPSSALTITLQENPDILAELANNKTPQQTLLGFALETTELEKNAKKKLAQKNCDWIVANEASAINAEHSAVILFAKNGSKLTLAKNSKQRLAEQILEIILKNTQ